MHFAALPDAASWRHVGARVGFETMFATTDATGVCLRGATAAVEDGEPWWVHYTITVDEGWRTTNADVWTRSRRGAAHVRIEGDGRGHWNVDGVTRPDLDGCLDVDLESSACTNTLPVHRLPFANDTTRDAPAVFVRAVDASVERLEQTYRRVVDGPTGDCDGSVHMFRYESPAFEFTARLTFDERGLVVDYPGIAERVF
jgi:hypothetical protein